MEVDEESMAEIQEPSYSESDRKHMRRALHLAAQALGKTRPNPVVGCVILDQEGVVVGEGFHPKAGQPHAEVFALKEAGDRARGGTVYVTLEPCNHHGKTPPCVDALLEAGIKKVVAGMVDPFPLVGGKGLARLADNGVEVVVGCEEGKCQALNRPFVHRLQHGTPLGFLPLTYSRQEFVRPAPATVQLGDGGKALEMIDAIVVDFNVKGEGLQTVAALQTAGLLQDEVVRIVLANDLSALPVEWAKHKKASVRKVVLTTSIAGQEAAVEVLEGRGVEVIAMPTDPLAVGKYMHGLGLLSALWLLCPEGAKRAVKAGVVQDLWIHATLQEADDLDGVDDPDFLGRQFGRPMKMSVMSCDAVGTKACLLSLTIDDTATL